MSAPPFVTTYRLQLHKEFTFDDARELVPYLRRLGVSHAYSSPILKARPGSTHGYDVADPTTANPELGGEEARRRWCRALADAGLGLLLDIVPNHMGTGSANPFWEDVLTHGRASRYAHWFDIRWSGDVEQLRGRVLLPVLGDKLLKVVEREELGVALAGGRLRIRYFENEFPMDPATYPAVLERALVTPRGEARAPSAADIGRLREIMEGLEALPERAPSQREARSARADELLGALETLLERSAPLRRRLEQAAESFPRGVKGRLRIIALVEAQPYRLAFWRRAARLINYRRFFDINELVALRMESEAVFAEMHEHVLGWVQAGDVHGLRVDHIDGLLDPLTYLERLRGAVTTRAAGAGRGRDHEFPLLVEKILTPGEHLRQEWPVQGTTGYEFLNDLESVFLDADGADAITAYYRSLRPGTRRQPLDDFEEVAIRGKLRILTGALAPDVRGLAALLQPIARRDPRVAKLTRPRLTKALTEWLACFPVYRTYVDGRAPEPHGADRAVIERVAQRCRERGFVPPEVIDFLTDVTLRLGEGDERAARLRFVAKLQQTSGPAMAKGVEDTALYQYVPLVPLNEVGGEPVRELRRAVQRFHDANGERARDWPRNLLCTNTHDTKRSADVRARLDVLSEEPALWTAAVDRWRRMNEPHRSRAGRISVPDPNTEYLLYQTLLGVWPVGAEGEATVPGTRAIGELRERVEQYMLKAVKEAKLHTSWTEPDEEYEEALKGFIGAILPKAGAAKSEFLRDVAALASDVGRSGLWNSLSRIVLHTTSPGVPDLYRGDELWNFSLVDPDNRRPVDFAQRSELLAAVAEQYESSREKLLGSLVATPEDDRLKLLVTWRVLQARRAHERLFLEGSYRPLAVTGRMAGHVVAFERRLGEETVVVIAPRLTRHLTTERRAPIGGEVWGDTRVEATDESGGGWRCLIAGHTMRSERDRGKPSIAVGDALKLLPVAVLNNGGTVRNRT